MKFADFHKEFTAGHYSAAYLFMGAEEFLAEAAIQALVNRLVPESEQIFNYTVIYGTEADSLPDVLFTPPVFGRLRVTEVRHAQKLGKAPLNAVIRYLQKPPRDGCLILWAPEEPKKGKGGAGEKAKKELDFFASLERLIDPVICAKLPPNDLIPWMDRYVKRQKKSLDEDAKTRLSVINWPSLRELASELDRLTMMVGDEPEIRAKDVIEMGGGGFAMERWALTDAVGAGDACRAYKAIRNMSLQKLEPTQAIGDLFRLVYSLWAIRWCLDKRTPGAIPSLVKLHNYTMRTYTDLARKMRLDDIEVALLRVREADVNIKRGNRMGDLELNLLVEDLIHLLRA